MTVETHREATEAEQTSSHETPADVRSTTSASTNVIVTQAAAYEPFGEGIGWESPRGIFPRANV